MSKDMASFVLNNSTEKCGFSFFKGVEWDILEGGWVRGRGANVIEKLIITGKGVVF